MNHSTQSQSALRVFISYAHEDNEMRKEVVKHLALLQREHLIEKWDDRQIEGGDAWAGAIDANLEAADIVLLLVSASFLASDYCYDKEMNRALQRHLAGECRVIPVILRPCGWRTAPFGQLQAFPDQGKPISKWDPVDDGYVQVAEGLRRVIAELRPPTPLPPAPRLPIPVPPWSSAWKHWRPLALGGSLALVALALGAYWWLGPNMEVFGRKQEGQAAPQIEDHKPDAIAKRSDRRPEVPPVPTDDKSPSDAVASVRQMGKGGLYVLAVGVTTYRDKALDQGARFAAGDAMKVKEHFERMGAKRYRPVYVRGLRNEEATRGKIEEEMRVFSSRVAPNDVFVLFLAGYGAAFERNYHFIPYEARYINTQRLREESLGQDGLRRLLAGVRTSNVLVILDTCSLGASGDQRAVANDRDAIGQLRSLTGRPLIAAAADDRMAQEGEGDHGVFTFVLLEGLRGAADDNKNGVIELKELADYVEKTVPEITKRKWNHERFPFSQIGNVSFSLLPKPGGSR
jgi:TIR domain/Caspase domain